MSITGYTSLDCSIHKDDQILTAPHNERNVTHASLESESKIYLLCIQHHLCIQKSLPHNYWIYKGQHVLPGPKGAINNTAKQRWELVVAKRHDPTFPSFLHFPLGRSSWLPELSPGRQGSASTSEVVRVHAECRKSHWGAAPRDN